MERSVFVAVFAVLVASLAVLIYDFATRDVFSSPVRYKWQDRMGRARCIVVAAGETHKPCSRFSADELNKFRLEYTNPHRMK